MPEKCPICKEELFEELGMYRNQHVIFSGLRRVRCLNCELVYASPMPGEETLREYNANYFVSAHGGITQSDTALAFFQAIAEIRTRHLEIFLKRQNVKIDSVFEIGPGPGYFASTLLSRYPELKYFAYETDLEAKKILRDMGVQITEIPVQNIDLLVISHVLEHVPDPVLFLSQYSKKLQPGGALFIEVPCRDDLHKPEDEPHLLFFEKNPMQLLLEKSGFGNIELSYHGESLRKLRSKRSLISRYRTWRTQKIDGGLLTPFANKNNGLDNVSSKLGRAIVKPFAAHKTLDEPAWWLRACAIKVTE